ncbi:hypothetical protein FQ775_06845 [Nitratireductor mangrovi]|uniref:CBS domain-containing protein n=1 Tax=Nitratireductor mangrovi TaxID=2599600 RepID=A0A5B8KX22_9HYPH|nr:hypothetical protein [Nitratireductor mangrovi]QDZ00121.1 hypothetical protein FQ775_06845 [Nitratireductor mangrovi]
MPFRGPTDLATDWASNHDGSLEALRRVQGNLTVDLIMVRRDAFDTCSLDETAAQIKRRNAKQFSYFPVADAEEQILGLYNAERWFTVVPPDTRVADDFEGLSEDMLIGADASIVDFVVQADSHPTNLVVSGRQIAGLVSLSDIQQLPARAAIFALITSLEMAMSLAISGRYPNCGDWMALLSEERRIGLLEEIEKAQQRDIFLSEIAFTQIHDKACIVGKSGLLDRSRTSVEKSFKKIRALRDNVAHANNYAATPAEARSVCGVVRDVYKMKSELLKVIEQT